ncbi:hypothetical protein Tco_1549446 [Tanacetum coccineum]
MSTQQEIYVAGSKNRPPMLIKANYVPWYSRLLHYAKIKPNGKLIYNSILNGPYVRRMIPELGDPDCEVPVAETFPGETDDELTEKEVKQIEADDQAIQIILMGHLEYIYAIVDSCKTAQEIWLRIQQMMKGSDIGIQDKKAKLFNEWERFTSTDGESIGSYYHRFSKRHVTIVHQTKDLHEVDYTQLYGFLKYNQAEVNELRAERLARAHDPLALMVDCIAEYEFRLRQTDADAQNLGVQNVGNHNGLIVVLEIANPNANQIGNGNVVAARAEGNLNRNNDGSAEVHEYDHCYNNEIFNIFTQEEQYTDLLEPILEPHQIQHNDSNVISMVSSVEQSRGTVEQNPNTVEETLDTRLQNFEIQFLKEAAKFVRDFKSLAKEADESLAKNKALEFEIERLLRAVATYNDMQQKIKWLQAQLGDLKGKSKDTPCESHTLDSLSQKLENGNVELEF